MATSKSEIEGWFNSGVAQGATHMIVVCDTFDWDDYPAYVMPGEDFWKRHASYDGVNMQTIMEVYDLKAPAEPQFAMTRCFSVPPKNQDPIAGEAITEFRGKNRWLSNFHECTILYEGVNYPTTEHAYQAAKTTNVRVREAMAKLPKPADAMHVGRALIVRPDWKDVSFQVMYDVNLRKFLDHDDLREKLLATGDVHIEEGNRHGDVFWGTVDGKGENHLGKVLMYIRKEIKEDGWTKFDDELLLRKYKP